MKIALTCWMLAISGILHASIMPSRLTCEYLPDPTAVDVLQPRLSWINEAGNNDRGIFQTARQVRVASSREQLLAGTPDLWDSGKIPSAESVNIVYNGKPLTSRQDCWWQVRVWDNKGKASHWSEPAFWSMGLLHPGDWKAQWIGAPWQGEEAVPRLRSPKNKAQTGFHAYKPENLPSPAPLLRKEFTLAKTPVKARAYVTGLGFFEFYMNGQKVGDDVLVPNLTLYGKREKMGDIGVYLTNMREYRVMYLAYDILPYLRQGDNVAGAMLGNGFYNPANYWTEGYGTPRFLGQIHITYSDGSEEIIASDTSWKVAEGPVRLDNIYDGEHYDARKELSGWSAPGFNGQNWKPAVARKAPEGKLTAHLSPTDKVMETLPPQKIEQLGDGHYRVDFGQEISGWLRLQNVSGKEGHRIDIRYTCESPMGDNSYTMKGGAPESYAARFTWFVFREVEITNWPGELTAENLRAEAVYTNVETTGKFECSNPLFNQIDRAWWRSQTDNMHGGVASDCPHRERSAYTGDGQVACVTVMHHFDARAFYSKWIRDIWGNQNPDNGYVPNGAPWQPGCGGGVAWGAAICIMPWEFYLHYGDTSILRDNFEAMQGYLGYMLTWTGEDGIMHSQAPSKEKPNKWMNLGDWVAPRQLPPDEMVHTFYLWRCADLTAQTASVLGNQSEALKYGALAGKTWKAFMDKFYDPVKGSYGPNGGNVFALKMGVPASQKARVLAALQNDIKANNGHLDTGIFGTQFFFEILAENGLDELAYAALDKRTQPSYGWWLEQGATTTWEQWDGTNSRNHPMFGGGLTWLYRKLAGLQADPDNPGYKHIIFRPQPAGDMTYASYSNRTPYGDASIRWDKKGEKFSMSVKVPAGSTATVFVPVDDPSLVRESGKKTARAKGVKFLEKREGYAVYAVSSGNYRFEAPN